MAHQVIIQVKYLIFKDLNTQHILYFGILYLVGEGGINLLLELSHDLWVRGQIVSQERERTAACFITSKNENHGLGKDLMVT